MAWIKSFQELRDHPKTKRAARTLGIKKIHLIGHLHGLWWWAGSYAEDGSLAGYGPEDIAEAAEWDGDPVAFVNALLGCGVNGSAGFLERGEDGNLLIHDWDEYAGKLMERRATERERQRNKRMPVLPSIKDVGATLQQHTPNVDTTSAPREEVEVEKSRSRVESTRPVAAADVPNDLRPFDTILRAFDGYSPSPNFFTTVEERYAHLPLSEEAVKATEWLRANRKRKCTTLFMLKWLSNAAQSFAARGSPNGYTPETRKKPYDL